VKGVPLSSRTTPTTFTIGIVVQNASDLLSEICHGHGKAWWKRLTNVTSSVLAAIEWYTLRRMKIFLNLTTRGF
jgi:hypothetical protein